MNAQATPATTIMATREGWLKAAAELITDEVITPALDMPPPPYRVSMKEPDARQTRHVVLGTCWARCGSADGHNEIFITASMGETDSVRLLDVLVHELLHAYDDLRSGHGPAFASMCRKVGLEPSKTDRAQASYTATVAGPELQQYLQELVDGVIGPIPHAALNPLQAGKPRQRNRQLLAECIPCGFKFRASRSALQSMTNRVCPACQDSHLVSEGF